MSAAIQYEIAMADAGALIVVDDTGAVSVVPRFFKSFFVNTQTVGEVRLKIEFLSGKSVSELNDLDVEGLLRTIMDGVLL